MNFCGGNPAPLYEEMESVSVEKTDLCWLSSKTAVNGLLWEGFCGKRKPNFPAVDYSFKRRELRWATAGRRLRKVSVYQTPSTANDFQFYSGLVLASLTVRSFWEILIVLFN